MKMKIYTEDAYSIIQSSGIQAQKYSHDKIKTTHLFLAMFSFLSVNKETGRYSNAYTTLKGILNKYEITGKLFKEHMELEPKTMTTPDAISSDNDLNMVVDILHRRALEEKRPMEVEDLIAEMFADNKYALAEKLSEILSSEMKADNLREEVVKAFKKAKMVVIEELEKMPEMLNLNKWVKDHPQTIIGADDAVKGVEMALAGRSVKSAMLTGPAGTGKTSIVYELAQRINNGDVPEFLKDKVVYEMNTNALVAGTR